MDCNLVAQEELKRLRDVQRLLQALVIALGFDINSIGLEEVL